MANEVQRIPPAPRRVAWRRVLGYRWPLALATFLLAVFGGALTWMLLLAEQERAADDRRLDREPCERLEVRLDAVQTSDSDRWDATSKAERVTYRFRYQGMDFDGDCYAPAGTYAVGQPATVEFLRGEPSKSRIVGAKAHLSWRLTDSTFWFVRFVVPGMIIGLLWLAGVFHLRRILAHGDVSVANVLSIDRVRYCIPECWTVRFQFRDHRAQERTSRHWVRMHSALGMRLLTMVRHGQFDRLPVLHDRKFPQYCRLVLPEDFAPDSRPIDPAATIRL